jgi:GNAT superfamily N-acetyltransferase
MSTSLTVVTVLPGKTSASAVRLVSAIECAPRELEDVLLELGAGNSRFGGTSFGRGECDLPVFLQECCDAEDAAKVPGHLVPQSTYWLVDESDKVVGIVRVRHRLNKRLLQFGGHIGYYVRPSERGKGYGTEALRLALQCIRPLGSPRALLTVNPANAPSIRYA